MTCDRCGISLPNGTVECPVCGTVVIYKGSKQLRTASMVHLSDALCLIMNLINLFVLITGAHTVVPEYGGLWQAKRTVFLLHPSMRVAEAVFGVFTVLLLILSTASYYLLRKARRLGVYLMTASHAGLLLWTVLYAVVCGMCTSIKSPFLGFCIAQAAVYLILVIYPTVHLFRSCDLY
ncbi:MAG: hypothetical protein IJN63_01965 [Clostridia bacterium]|nr:hypothetical protein [Clostridia bacterium]